jgi:hypothetical protein
MNQIEVMQDARMRTFTAMQHKLVGIRKCACKSGNAAWMVKHLLTFSSVLRREEDDEWETESEWEDDEEGGGVFELAPVEWSRRMAGGTPPRCTVSTARSPARCVG